MTGILGKPDTFDAVGESRAASVGFIVVRILGAILLIYFFLLTMSEIAPSEPEPHLPFLATISSVFDSLCNGAEAVRRFVRFLPEHVGGGGGDFGGVGPAPVNALMVWALTAALAWGAYSLCLRETRLANGLGRQLLLLPVKYVGALLVALLLGATNYASLMLVWPACVLGLIATPILALVIVIRIALRRN